MSEELDIQKSGKKIGKNIIKVAVSNLFTILAGVLVGFVIPKMMGTTDYGYYKIFTLYLIYVGLFHFGFVDGIYLVFGGKNYDELDKKKFRTYSKFFLIFQSIISLIITIIALCFVNYDYGFIFTFIGISLIFSNIITYYQYISQITGRFNELSIVNIVKSLLTIIAVMGLFVLYKMEIITYLQYQTYTIISTIILFLIAMYYLCKYKDITFGESYKIKDEKKELLSFFKIGIPLLVANLVLNFILNVDRQFVSLLFPTETYAVYAFAYNMLSLITVAISAIATVLYPTIKRFDEEQLKNNYNFFIALISFVSAVCLAAYFPLYFIVEYFLIDYFDSLLVFRIILPGLLLTTNITVIMFNYYKSLDKSKLFFIISVIAFVLAIISDLIVYLIFKSYIAITIVSIAVMFIWYIICDFFILKRFKGVKFINNYLFVILIMIAFYLSTAVNNLWIGLGIYLLSGLIITVLCQFDLVKKGINILKKKAS